MSEFKYPSIHDFPPFFTKQPTETTWNDQKRLWSGLILDYCRHHRLHTLRLSEALKTPLFSNSSIQLLEIIDFMVTNGDAEWTGKKKDKSSCIIYWRKPGEWADLIYQWVQDHGFVNTVMTAYELANGEDTADQEFHGIERDVLQKAIDILVSRGKAQVIQSASSDDFGVKFF
ncbi:hypothetical protein EV182_004556 [Spiromyces aspiralis]|uniref:Uncharacterized protein n=1 Tax=Spiromyces aspiralis TaxID=68401 RepID=A0ACC1HNS4_9FUNG|nr:hypothetical protein EV182_004556 [Spiromyces aspiralis]